MECAASSDISSKPDQHIKLKTHENILEKTVIHFLLQCTERTKLIFRMDGKRQKGKMSKGKNIENKNVENNNMR
jgi:hypothetical protein